MERRMDKGMVISEIKKQLWLSGPLFFTSLLQFLQQSISLMFVGHLGELALSGASVATSFAGVTGFSFLRHMYLKIGLIFVSVYCLAFFPQNNVHKAVLLLVILRMGLGSAMDTSCGQAFGAKQYPLLGVYLQRAVLVLTLVSIPISFLWAFTSQILTKLHQDKQVSAAAGIYICWMTPALFGYGILQCLIRFLQTQNIVFPLMITSGITTLLHVVLCWSLVFTLGLGAKGGALALSISYWFNVLLLILYINLYPACNATWSGVSRKAFHDVFRFMRVAIPSAAMICLEFWSFESLVILSGLLPNPKLQTSVVSISLNTLALVYMISMGLGAAVSTRVANELGAGNPLVASLAVRVAISMAIIEGLTVAVIMISVSSIWGHVYSNEAVVVKALAGMMPLVALTHSIDATQCVLSGTLRGCGWQMSGAFINLGSFYVVGIPCSIALAFVLHIGIKGLWIGIICALSLQDAMYLIIVLRANWEKEALKARESVHNSIIPVKKGVDSMVEMGEKEQVSEGNEGMRSPVMFWEQETEMKQEEAAEDNQVEPPQLESLDYAISNKQVAAAPTQGRASQLLPV